MKKPENIKQFTSDIFSNLNEIKKGIKETDWAKEDTTEIKAELLKAELMAYKIKLQTALDTLFQNQPDLQARDVLIKMLPNLRPDISPALLPILTEYILHEWEVKTRKLAA